MRVRISDLINYLNQKLESNIPEKYLISDNLLFKTKLVLSASIIVSIGWLAFAVSHYLLGDLHGALVLIVAAFLFNLTIVVFKFTKSLSFAANYQVLLTFLILNYFQVGLGIIGSPHGSYLILLPGMVYFYSDRKSFFIWCIIICATLTIHFLVLCFSSYPKLGFLPSMTSEGLRADAFTVQIGIFLVFMVLFYILETSRENLYLKITSQKEEILSQRDLVTKQKEQIETANSEMIASITYARYIQSSILPNKDKLDRYLKDYFILFKPRDIVSGDFYWLTNIENATVVAAVDCTGHGVPGAFMSIIGSAFLEEIVNKEYMTQPAIILRRLRKDVIRSLQQRGAPGEQKDGMDIALCSIDYDKMKLQFSGANNPLYLIRSNKNKIPDIDNQICLNESVLYEIKGDRMPVGIDDRMDNFTLHEVELIKGDQIYLFSDGFMDQFGGPSGKKLQAKNFRQFILAGCNESMEDQKQILEKALTNWQGSYNQTDDILVIGIKI